MKKLEKVISLLLIISMVFCSTGFNTLANSLYVKEQNSNKMLEQLKADLGEERANNIINEQIEEVELCESINEDEMSQNLEKPQNFSDIENIENQKNIENEYDEEPEEDSYEEGQLEDIEKNENGISENEVAYKDLLDLNDDAFDSENESNEKKEFEKKELEEVNEIEITQDSENVEVEKLKEKVESENYISEYEDMDETSLDFVESGVIESYEKINEEVVNIEIEKLEEEIEEQSEIGYVADENKIANNNKYDEIIDGTNDLEKENSSLDDSEKNIEKLGESEKESSTQLEKGKMNEVIEESTYESRLEQNINEKDNIDLLESSNLIKETNDDQELEKVEEVKEENIDIVELANNKVNGDKLKDETTIDRLDENTIASANEIMKDVANVLFGSGNNVYWYLTEADATLHLSGEEPTAPEYFTTGGTNYDKNSVTNKTAIAQVVIDNPIHPTNCESWFSDFVNLLTIIDIDNLDTTEVENMSKMFYNCKKLTSLDLSDFVTSEVIDMKSMFQFCEDLTSLNVSSFDTSKVVDMNRMFSKCNSLTSLDVGNFNTSQVTNMSFMFAFCGNVANLDVSNFVTSEVTDMTQMFNNCSSLTSLDVRNFNTSKVENMSSMFSGCSNITNLDVHNFNTNEVIYIFTMFKDCSSLTSLDVRNFDTSKVINIQGMFDGCNNLTSLDLSNFNMDQVPNDRISEMLANCRNLNYIKINESVSLKINALGLTGNWKNVDTKLVYYYDGTHTTIPTNLAGEYIGSCEYWYLTNSDTELHLSGTIPTAPEYAPGQDNYNKNSIVNKSIITKVVFDNMVRPFNCEAWFSGFENLLTFVDIDNLDTSEVINMSNMFYRCSNLTSLDVSNFNTSEATNMSLMFFRCNKLTIINVANFVTNKVIDMNRMFSMCSSLTNLDVRNFETSEVTNMSSMFAFCRNLASLDVRNFVTNKVTDMSQMFNNCSSITNLDVRNFNTSNVTNMSSMFGGCNDLISLDVRNFDTSKVTYIFEMFKDCSSLTNLDVRNFDTSQVENMQMMFEGCSNITNLDLSSFTLNPLSYDRINGMLNNCANLSHIKISESLSIKINEMNLTGDWRDAATGIVYTYNGSQTTIPVGIAGEYKKPVIITFETNGGTTKSNMVVGYGDKIATPTDVIKTGYYAENWCIDNLLTDAWDFENDVVNSDMTLYAKWTLAKYIIKYDTNGGTISPTQVTKTYTVNVTLDTPTKTGYIFDGWFIDNNTFINQYDGTTDLSGTQGTVVNIYAKWIAISYTINYNANGGTMSSTQIAKTYDINIILDIPTKTGYAFVGWYADNDTFINQYEGTTDLSSTAGAVVDIYAKWTLATYIIKYNTNGGTISPTQITKTYTVNTTLDTPTKTGYTFVGWYVDNGTFINVYDGTTDLSNMQDDEVDIYAKWSENSYILKLNPNPMPFDETLIGTEISETLTYTQMKTLTNPFISSKYNFVEWRTNADGTGTSYALNQEVNQLAAGNGEVITLYAKWKAGTYKVRYLGNGATYGSMDDSIFACDEEVALSTNSFVKKGYRFNKWTENSNGSGASFTGGQLVTNLFNAKKDEIKNLYANWVLATYNIKYNTNGGDVSPTQITKTYSENVKLATPSKVGYYFAGWYIDNYTFMNYYDGTTDLADTQDAVVEIYAKWLLDSSYAEVTFDSNGGSAVETQAVKSGLEKAIRPADPTKEGFIFVDWYKEIEFINVWDFDNEIVTENITLYAKWESIITKYTVTFNSNGGTIVASVVVNKGEKVARPVNPRKSGYTFVNWYKEAQLISRFDFNTAITSDITLYAKWAKNIPISGGGGSGGGGGMNVISQRDPVKESAIPSCEKNKNTNEFNNNLIKWKYDPIRKIWGLDVTVNGERVSYKYGYATIDKHTYYFNEKGDMVTGWVKDTNGDYYAFEWQKTTNEGMMLFGWRLVNDKWYYFMENGKLLINGVSPDGYEVDAEGVWIK